MRWRLPYLEDRCIIYRRDPFFEENAMALTIFGIRQPFFRSGCIIYIVQIHFSRRMQWCRFSLLSFPFSALLFQGSSDLWCLAKCFHPSLGIFRDVDRYKTFWLTSGLGVCERQKNAIVRVHPIRRLDSMLPFGNENEKPQHLGFPRGPPPWY